MSTLLAMLPVQSTLLLEVFLMKEQIFFYSQMEEQQDKTINLDSNTNHDHPAND